MAEDLRVLVTGAAGQIAYSLVGSIAKGDVFGRNQKIILHLLDIPPMAGVLDGVVMELNDCALPLLKEVVPTTDEITAFRDIDVAFLVGAMPRREGMERKDLLSANVKIFKTHGNSLNTVSKKSVKVVVVGNPANTNAMICQKYAPTIPKENFSCMTRLDQNRAQSLIAHRIGVPNSDVYNVIVWGNHSSTQFPDVSQAKVVQAGQQSEELSVVKAVNDDNWLNTEFIKTVQTRGAAVIKARKLSSAMSAAKAVCDHVHDWWFGTPEGRFTSMGVISDGSYGIPEGMMYSFPVTIQNREWKIVKDLPRSDAAREKMDVTQKELQEEREMALEVCKD